MGAEADRDPHLDPPRYLTPDIPGVGGRLRVRIEDFLVEELPLYAPSGEGEHIYLFVEKRNLSTLLLVQTLARHFGVGTFQVGYAGLKDRRAITRQVVSIHTPGRSIEDFPALRDERITVLWADRHGNKLRRGHLAGNRFSIRIRDVPVQGVLAARRVLEHLARVGVPNRCDAQRFGHIANNHLVGRAIILGRREEAVRELLGPSDRFPDIQREAREAFVAGDYHRAYDLFGHNARTERNVLRAMRRDGSFRDGARAISRAERSFYITAFQSAVFNAVLDRRLIDDTLGSVLPGDAVFKHANGRVFPANDAVLDDPTTAERLRSLEISPSGPMWGVSMQRADGAIARVELELLERAGVTLADLDAFETRSPGLVEGARRPLRVPLRDPQVEAGVDEHGAFIRCAFELPRGAFATSVMREIMKPSPAGLPSPPPPADPPDDPDDPDPQEAE